MSVMYEYQVKEDVGYIETFGFYHSPTLLQKDDVIQLRWLDGKPAYKAKVISVQSNFIVYVEQVKEPNE